MSDTFIVILEAASDPWALALISLILSWVIVVCGAVAMDPPRNHREDQDDQDFFTKVTRFHNEV